MSSAVKKCRMKEGYRYTENQPKDKPDILLKPYVPIQPIQKPSSERENYCPSFSPENQLKRNDAWVGVL